MLSVMRVLFAEDPSNSIRGPILLSKNCWAYFYEIIATHGILAVHVVKNRFKFTSGMRQGNYSQTTGYCYSFVVPPFQKM